MEGHCFDRVLVSLQDSLVNLCFWVSEADYTLLYLRNKQSDFFEHDINIKQFYPGTPEEEMPEKEIPEETQ